MAKTSRKQPVKKRKAPAKSAGTAGRDTASAKSAGTAKPDKLTAEKTRRFHFPARQAKPGGMARLPSAITILSKSLRILWANRLLFLGICAVYLLLTVIFVRGFSGGANLSDLKESIGNPSGLNQLAAGVALFAVLLTTSGNGSSQAAGAYQSFLLVIVSLAIIWALRQVMAGQRIRTRDAYYQGMYPLVPVLLVLAVIGIQLLPVLLGATLYTLVVTGGITVGVIEQAVVGGLFFITGLISLYLISSSVMALYVASLPDMTPLKALRSARELTRFRRWSIARKLVFLPFALFLGAAVLMVPVILVATPLAPWIFFALSAVGIAVIHSYLYTLYRELLP